MTNKCNTLKFKHKGYDFEIVSNEEDLTKGQAKFMKNGGNHKIYGSIDSWVEYIRLVSGVNHVCISDEVKGVDITVRHTINNITINDATYNNITYTLIFTLYTTGFNYDVLGLLDFNDEDPICEVYKKVKLPWNRTTFTTLVNDGKKQLSEAFKEIADRLASSLL